jgi:hypothetical protein
MKRALAWAHHPVKQEMLDPDMVVEVLEVNQLPEREPGVKVNRRTAVE